MAFETIKPRSSCLAVDIINKKITNSLNIKLEVCSKAKMQLLSTFENQFLGLHISH